MSKLLATLIIVCMMAISYHANAVTITYTLDNIVLIGDDFTPGNVTGTVITGKFDWTYDGVDMEGGSGVFTEIWIEADEWLLSELKFNVETKSISISLLENINNEGVDIQFKFNGGGFTEQGGDLNLATSTWSLRGGGAQGVFESGGVTPLVIPIPAAIWLLGTGLIALLGFARRKV